MQGRLLIIVIYISHLKYLALLITLSHHVNKICLSLKSTWLFHSFVKCSMDGHNVDVTILEVLEEFWWETFSLSSSTSLTRWAPWFALHLIFIYIWLHSSSSPFRIYNLIQNLNSCTYKESEIAMMSFFSWWPKGRLSSAHQLNQLDSGLRNVIKARRSSFHGNTS